MTADGAREQAASYPPAFPLKHAQKDMKLALLLADDVGVGLPTSAAANEQVNSQKICTRFASHRRTFERS